LAGRYASSDVLFLADLAEAVLWGLSKLLGTSFHASGDTGDRFGLPEAFRSQPPEYAGFNPRAQPKNKIPAKTIIKFRVAKAAKDGVLGVKK
jgi:hypothetical protein